MVWINLRVWHYHDFVKTKTLKAFRCNIINNEKVSTLCQSIRIAFLFQQVSPAQHFQLLTTLNKSFQARQWDYLTKEITNQLPGSCIK